MSWHRVSLLLALSISPAASQLGAQEGTLADSTLVKALTAKHVRVRLRSGEEVEIRRPQVTAGLVRGAEGDQVVREVPLGDVQMVWRRASATQTGGLIGAATGAAAGAIGAVALSTTCMGLECSSSSTSDKAEAAVLGAGAGALVGAGVGALIGALIHRWQLVYRRDERVAALVYPGRIGVRLTF